MTWLSKRIPALVALAAVVVSAAISADSPAASAGLKVKANEIGGSSPALRDRGRGVGDRGDHRIADAICQNSGD